MKKPHKFPLTVLISYICKCLEYLSVDFPQNAYGWHEVNFSHQIWGTTHFLGRSNNATISGASSLGFAFCNPFNSLYYLYIFSFIIGVLLMYLPVTITGYLAYGSNVAGNVLQSLPSGPLRVSAEVLIIVHILCAFVINLNPFSQDMEELFNIPHSRHFVQQSV